MRNQLHTYTAAIKGSDGIFLNMIFDLDRFYEMKAYSSSMLT
jgi:hypothetical protein